MCAYIYIQVSPYIHMYVCVCVYHVGIVSQPSHDLTNFWLVCASRSSSSPFRKERRRRMNHVIHGQGHNQPPWLCHSWISFLCATSDMGSQRCRRLAPKNGQIGHHLMPYFVFSYCNWWAIKPVNAFKSLWTGYSFYTSSRGVGYYCMWQCRGFDRVRFPTSIMAHLYKVVVW